MVDSADACARIFGRFGIAGLALGLVACGGGSDGPERAADAGSCTTLKPGGVVTLDADVQVLASHGVPSSGPGSLTHSVVASGGEVYWYDSSGSIFVERQDQQVVELRHVERSPRDPESALGLAANSEHLYVGYASGGYDDVGFPAYKSPGHLLAISKQDGQVTSLLEYEQGWLTPITANDERVIVFAMGSPEMGFYQVPLDHPRLEALPLGTSDGSIGSDHEILELWELFESGQLVEDQVYWMNTQSPPYGRLRSRFDDAEPELLTPLPWEISFSAGPDYLLTAEYAVDSDKYRVGLDFLLTDDAGCRAVRGPRGEGLVAVALDAKYAYWSGYRASEADATLRQTLNRVSVETGAVERLNAPGVTPESSLRFVAQDDTHLFLWNNGALLSLRKP